MIVSSNGSDFKPIPEGTYIATCVRVIDLGTQVTTYMGADKLQRKVLVAWEVPDEMVEFEGKSQPALIQKRYTASLSDKANLRKDLEAWRGRRFTDEELRGFDLKNVLGSACQIQVLHSEDGAYANVQTIMALPKGMPKPEPIHSLINFSLDPAEYSEGVYGLLSDKLKQSIAQSPEYKALNGGLAASPTEDFARNDLDDEIPF